MIRNHKEPTPYIVTTKIRIYLIALIYFITMIISIGSILAINYYHINSIYRNILVSQIQNLDKQIEWYLDTLKIKLNQYIAIISKENKQPFQQKYTNFNIDSIIFKYDTIHDKYIAITPSDNFYTSKMYIDLKQYIEQESDAIVPLHALVDKTEIVTINNTWYLITSTYYKDSDMYILSAIEIYTKKLNDILQTYTYTTPQKELVLYPIISDINGTIWHYPIHNKYQINHIPKEFITITDKIFDYKYQGSLKSSINKISNNIPWLILTMTYDKGYVLNKIISFNIFPTIGFIVANVIMIFIFINKSDTSKVLNNFKKYGVTCVCEGECIAERIHCKSLLSAYKKRIRNIYEFFYNNIKNNMDNNISSMDTLSLLKEIDAELDKEINKFDDPKEFRIIASRYLKKK